MAMSIILNKLFSFLAVVMMMMLMVKITMTIMAIRIKTTITDDDVYGNDYGDGNDHDPTTATTMMSMVDTRVIYERKISHGLHRMQTCRLNDTF